jgi:hypothetical protein
MAAMVSCGLAGHCLVRSGSAVVVRSGKVGHGKVSNGSRGELQHDGGCRGIARQPRKGSAWNRWEWRGS